MVLRLAGAMPMFSYVSAFIWSITSIPRRGVPYFAVVVVACRCGRHNEKEVTCFVEFEGPSARDAFSRA